MIEKIYYDIKDLRKDCHRLYFELAEIQKFKPEVVIGIARGGAIPATFLAYEFDIPLLTLNISFYEGMIKSTNVDKSALIIQIHNFLTIHNLKSKNLLIVDDIVDTGETLSMIKDFVSEKFRNNIKFVSLFKAEDTPKNLHPDFYLYEKPKNSWVIFPWENLYKK